MLRLTNDIVPNSSILSILGQLGSRLAAFSRRRFIRVVCRFFGLVGGIAICLAIATSFVESAIVISYSKIDVVGCWTAPLRGRWDGGCRTIASEDFARSAAGDGPTRLSVVVRLS